MILTLVLYVYITPSHMSEAARFVCCKTSRLLDIWGRAVVKNVFRQINLPLQSSPSKRATLKKSPKGTKYKCKFCSKIEILVKIQILVKNRNFGQINLSLWTELRRA